MKVHPILIIMLIAIIQIPLSYAQVSPDNFEKDVRGGESFTINFAIFNDNNETIFFHIITPHLTSDWKVISDPESGILKPHQAKEIKVEFTAPRASLKEIWYLKIIVEMYNESGLVDSHEVHLTVHFETNMLGGLYFNLPFPEEWGYWGSFLNAIIFWVIAGMIVFGAFYILKRAVKKTKTKADDILLNILHTPIVLWVIVYGIYTSLLLFPLSNELFEDIYIIYQVVTILIITWIIYRVYRDLIIHYAFRFRDKLGKMEGALISALEKIGIASILSMSGIMVLQALGVDVTVLLASMGVLGIILGFAAQDTIGNLFSGIHILLDRSIEVGDYIILENDENVYKVKDVGLRSTKLYDIFANTIVYIPNNIIANHKIINLSRPDNKLELRIDVGVSYDSDIKLVKETLMEIAMEHPHVLKDDKYKPNVVFREFGDSSYNFTMYVWIDNLVDQWRVMSSLREKIVEKFRERGIEIPYPQVDVHIKK